MHWFIVISHLGFNPPVFFPSMSFLQWNFMSSFWGNLYDAFLRENPKEMFSRFAQGMLKELEDCLLHMGMAFSTIIVPQKVQHTNTTKLQWKHPQNSPTKMQPRKSLKYHKFLLMHLGNTSEWILMDPQRLALTRPNPLILHSSCFSNPSTMCLQLHLNTSSLTESSSHPPLLLLTLWHSDKLPINSSCGMDLFWRSYEWDFGEFPRSHAAVLDLFTQKCHFGQSLGKSRWKNSKKIVFNSDSRRVTELLTQLKIQDRFLKFNLWFFWLLLRYLGITYKVYFNNSIVEKP